MMSNPNLFEQILAHLQNTEIVDDEEDFFFFNPEDVTASQEEQRRSCVGKHVAVREINA